MATAEFGSSPGAYELVARGKSLRVRSFNLTIATGIGVITKPFEIPLTSDRVLTHDDTKYRPVVIKKGLWAAIWHGEIPCEMHLAVDVDGNLIRRIYRGGNVRTAVIDPTQLPPALKDRVVVRPKLQESKAA